jgi:hypothetical protein
MSTILRKKREKTECAKQDLAGATKGGFWSIALPPPSRERTVLAKLHGSA